MVELKPLSWNQFQFCLHVLGESRVCDSLFSSAAVSGYHCAEIDKISGDSDWQVPPVSI